MGRVLKLRGCWWGIHLVHSTRLCMNVLRKKRGYSLTRDAIPRNSRESACKARKKVMGQSKLRIKVSLCQFHSRQMSWVDEIIAKYSFGKILYWEVDEYPSLHVAIDTHANQIYPRVWIKQPWPWPWYSPQYFISLCENPHLNEWILMNQHTSMFQWFLFTWTNDRIPSKLSKFTYSMKKTMFQDDFMNMLVSCPPMISIVKQ